MMDLRGFLALILLASHAAIAIPPVLVNSAHGADTVRDDFVILHPELHSTAGLSALDNTCGNGTTTAACVSNTVFDVNIVADTQNASLSNVNVQSWQYPVNHAPYGLVNNSFSGYTLTGWGDPATYAPLQTYGVLMSWAFVQAQPAGTPPPLTSTTTTATSGPAALAGTNWGLEFGISNNYKGFDTSSPSWVTAGMTAILAAMKVDHPDWSWFDIKAALRQTASNWATGWDAAQFGYGAVDYDSATAIASTAALYLQPPLLQAVSLGDKVSITVYPFRSSRRDHEVVYAIAGNYVFPIKNELTAGDIANLVCAGGQLIYIGNTADVILSGTPAFAPATGGTYTLFAFTTDGAGAYSRVEAWSPQSVTLTGTATTGGRPEHFGCKSRTR